MKGVAEDRPFRGPKNFKEDDFVYFDESKWDIKKFVGVEKIFYQGNEVYRLDYHGGFVWMKAD